MLPVKFKKHEDMILNQHLKIVLTKKEHQELKKYCYERNMSMNDFVRNLIKKVINRKSDK